MEERITDAEMEEINDESDQQLRRLFRDMAFPHGRKVTKPKRVECPKCAHKFVP